MLISGNKKLSKDILIFNLPPGKSCLNCQECYNTCYARKAYRQYPNVKIAWDRNFINAKNGDFVNSIISELTKTKKKIVRIHSSGDFFSQEYVASWHRIIESFPGIRFYAYTKVKKILVFSEIESLPNFNLISSFIDGKLNYGSLEYIKSLGGFICPATVQDGIRCGENCNYCITHKRVCFKIH